MITVSNETIVGVFWNRVHSTPDKPAVYFKEAGSYKSITWSEYASIVEKISAALIKRGMAKGTNVGIMSQNCPQWSFSDISIMSSGAATVPIYATLSPHEVAYLVNHSEIKALFIGNKTQLEKLFNNDKPPAESLQFVITMDDSTIEHDTHLEIITWTEFLAEGSKFKEENHQLVFERQDSIEPDDLATIVYTSGTTGFPKGAMILQRNLYAVLTAMSEFIKFTDEDIALSFLPLSHVYERVGGQFTAIYNGLPFAYAESMETVATNINEIKPTVLNAVPRFYEKVYQRIQAQIRQMPKTQQAFVKWALNIGYRATKQRVENKVDISVWKQLYRAELRIAEQLVFKKIRERLGGRLKMMTSGAAPLSNDVHLFFEAIGLSIIEGYGLTETCAPLACNRPNDIKFRTVGKPLPTVEVKLGEDGELLVRGPTVFAGYYKNDKATEAAFEGDWFKTGDIAEIDEEGYISITDRKKDIIITAGGKHVAPQMIENMYKGESLIAHALAYGDRRKYISAMFAVNRDGLRSFAKKQNLEFTTIEELIENPVVIDEIQRVVDLKNENLANYQRIKKFTLLPRELTIEENELTPTMKIKRKRVTEKYKDKLDRMYDQQDLETQTA